MGLNHTIQLYNYPAVQGMCDLINKNVWVDCIITEFRRKYFNEETIQEELACVANHMSAILASEGTVYIKVCLEDIPLVSEIFVNHCFRLKNLLTIKIPVEHPICRTNKYIDCGVNYVLFFGRADHNSSYFNATKYSPDKTCHYTSDWSWFTGETMIDAYRAMIAINTKHADTILDPFMYLGDVGVAAIQQDRHFIGIEENRICFDYAKKRLDELGE